MGGGMGGGKWGGGVMPEVENSGLNCTVCVGTLQTDDWLTVWVRGVVIAIRYISCTGKALPLYRSRSCSKSPWVQHCFGPSK